MDVLGHRGLIAPQRAENTVAAVAAALEAGADGVEVDVRLSADGVPVACHDADLARVAGVHLRVADLTLSALRTVQLLGGERIATLAELADTVAGRGRLVAEIKAESAGTQAAARRCEVVTASCSVLNDSRLGRADILISSFSRSHVAGVRAVAPELATGMLGTPGQPIGELVGPAMRAGHAELHPHLSAALAAPRLVERARALGLGVCVWTVNRPADLVLLEVAGVDAVITDRTPVARALLAGRSVGARPA